MNEIAGKLNAELEGTIAGALLSERGRRLYFPRGIVAQSAEAKEQAHNLNATAGIAAAGGQPLFLPSIKEHLPHLKPAEIVSYAPTAGVPELRDMWMREMIQKNPSLAGKDTSRPVVVSGLTHGLAVLADLFIEPGDTVILPDLYWGNYRLIFEDRMQARIRTFALFAESGSLNLEGLHECLCSEAAEDAPEKVILLLNFPNNPTGYTPSQAEAGRLIRLLHEAAERGRKILLICDDAYFGLFYEEDTYAQSIFAEAADLHENILAFKVDGATKENLVWGFRIGFLTFASRSLRARDTACQALSQKLLGAVRGSVSSSSVLGQSLLLKAMQSRNYAEEKRSVFRILEERYRRSRQILAGLPGPLKVLPFNSGYFLCFDTAAVRAEQLRQRLLVNEGIGTISIRDHYLRVAYSSVDVQALEQLYASLAANASALL